MTNEQKQQVKNALVRFTISFPTLAKAATKLKDVQPTTIAQIRNNNWENISDKTWHNIASQVGYNTQELKPADTSAYLLLRILFSDARNSALAYGIALGSGVGKTFAANWFRKENEQVSYLACNEQYDTRSFIQALLNAEGLIATGSLHQLVEVFTNHIIDKDAPLLLLDDADKLKDSVINLVAMIANKLACKAGVIIMGNSSLNSKIVTGRQLKKAGFDTLYQTIGRRFITLNDLSFKDLELVCIANDVIEPEMIKYIATQTGSNLHEVNRLIRQANQHQNIAA